LYPTTTDVLAAQSNATEWDAITPLPDRGMLTGALDVLVVREIVPEVFPAPEGTKFTSKVTNWPGDSIAAVPMPLAVNPAPVTEFCWSVRGLPPKLENVTPIVLLEPTATSPKSTLELFTTKTAGAGIGAGAETETVEEEGARPGAQPAETKTATTRNVHNQLILEVIRKMSKKYLAIYLSRFGTYFRDGFRLAQWAASPNLQEYRRTGTRKSDLHNGSRCGFVLSGRSHYIGGCPAVRVTRGDCVIDRNSC
jgi:hypothetical protein